MKKFLLPLLLLFFIACDNKNDSNNPGKVDGLKPIYTFVEDVNTVSDENPIAITKGYKIHIKGNYVYIVEKGVGVHVIDNTNPSSPSNMRFIKVAGVSDAAVRNTTLYANNLNDIIAVNISDLENVSVTSRLDNLFNIGDYKFPPNYSGYFECVDDNKGVVIDWEEAVLDNPKCLR